MILSGARHDSKATGVTKFEAHLGRIGYHGKWIHYMLANHLGPPGSCPCLFVRFFFGGRVPLLK